jgi:hypothetical protein
LDVGGEDTDFAVLRHGKLEARGKDTDLVELLHHLSLLLFVASAHLEPFVECLRGSKHLAPTKTLLYVNGRNSLRVDVFKCMSTAQAVVYLGDVSLQVK